MRSWLGSWAARLSVFLMGTISSGSFHCLGRAFNVDQSLRDGPALMGVRAEDVMLETDTESCMAGQIRSIDDFGHEQLLYIGVGDCELIARATRTDAKVGDTIRFSLRESNITFFDPHGEQRRLGS